MRGQQGRMTRLYFAVNYGYDLRLHLHSLKGIFITYVLHTDDLCAV